MRNERVMHTDTEPNQTRSGKSQRKKNLNEMQRKKYTQLNMANIYVLELKSNSCATKHFHRQTTDRIYFMCTLCMRLPSRIPSVECVCVFYLPLTRIFPSPFSFTGPCTCIPLQSATKISLPPLSPRKSWAILIFFCNE